MTAMEDFNLCSILKNYTTHIFYSAVYGRIQLWHVGESMLSFRTSSGLNIYFKPDGTPTMTEGQRPTVYPSMELYVKYPLDAEEAWREWEETKKNTVKTWEDMRREGTTKSGYVAIDYKVRGEDGMTRLDGAGNSANERSALALIKIRQLIDVAYGGNVTEEEWATNAKKFTLLYNVTEKGIVISATSNRMLPIAFHTIQQANEFISHPSNVKLVKDFYII